MPLLSHTLRSVMVGGTTLSKLAPNCCKTPYQANIVRHSSNPVPDHDDHCLKGEYPFRVPLLPGPTVDLCVFAHGCSGRHGARRISEFISCWSKCILAKWKFAGVTAR